MSESSPLSILADKLPPEQRAQFLAMSVRLKNLPADDELVVALEALGFTTLILKQIPEEISETISKMRSGLDDAQRAGLREDIEEILIRSLDTPSYKDLRETIRELKDQQNRFKQNMGGLAKSLSAVRVWLERRNAIAPSLGLGLCSGIIAGGLVVASQLFLVKTPVESSLPSPLPDPLQQGLGYFEVDLPEFGGTVGLVTVRGDVISTFVDGDSGIVVVRPARPQAPQPSP